MTLLLRIENYDQLDNGGPTWLRVEGHGISVGRRSSMDWVLPDPTKMISGHHFDISFQDGTYWIIDVSTNGTYPQGQRHRLSGPVPLQGGERFSVGHYVIAVDLEAAPQPQPEPAPPYAAPEPAPAPPEEPDDPWDTGAGPLDPVDPLARAGNRSDGLDSVAGAFVPVQRPGMAQPPAQGTAGLQMPQRPQGPAPDRSGIQASEWTWGPSELPDPEPAQSPAPPPQSRPAPPHPSGLSVPPYRQPQGYDAPPQPPDPPRADPPYPEAPAAPSQRSEARPQGALPALSMPSPDRQPRPAPRADTPRPGTGGDAQAALRAFCEGAGLDPSMAANADAVRLMHALGQSVRVATGEVMKMLRSRDDVKAFTRGGTRTMLSATANNPMKFLPDSQEALEAMFLSPRDGFMEGAEAFDDALRDVRLHQEAIFRALQPALREVFAGLSPEEIEAAAEASGNLLSGGRKGKHWGLYVERWDKKAQAGENGMLDAFLQAFARTYAAASTREDPGG